MKDFFVQYTRDGILTLHLVFSAYDRADAFYVLETTFDIREDEILDLHEIVY